MRTPLISFGAIAVAAVIAGCGSSNSSSKGGAAVTTPSTSAPSSGQAVSLATKKNATLGTILAAGTNDLTVYMFTRDTSGQSACSGQCATIWRPVAGSGKAIAGAKQSLIGSIKRSDGSTQATYAGHPLYLFTGDKDGSDATGEGLKTFGGEWFALTASGAKVNAGGASSASGSGTATTSGSGGGSSYYG